MRRDGNEGKLSRETLDLKFRGEKYGASLDSKEHGNRRALLLIAIAWEPYDPESAHGIDTQRKKHLSQRRRRLSDTAGKGRSTCCLDTLKLSRLRICRGKQRGEEKGGGRQAGKQDPSRMPRSCSKVPPRNRTDRFRPLPVSFGGVCGFFFFA